MCRMLGMVLSPTAKNNEAAGADNAPAVLPSWEHLVHAPNSLRLQAETGRVLAGDSAGHDDSWGVGWIDDAAQVSLLRQTGSAAGSAFFVFASEAAARAQAGSGPARTLIGHLRKASCGVVTSENAHPIRADYRPIMGEEDEERRSGSYDSILVAHNGTLRKPLLELLRSDLLKARRAEAGSDSDSVVLAGWLASRLRLAKEASIFETIAAALSELFRIADEVSGGDRVSVYSAVNLLLIHSSGLYALRQFSRDGDYYTLCARPLKKEEDGAEGWIIASEATDVSERWTPLTPGVLNFYPSQEASEAAQTLQVAVN
jgi:predicted glutamine amidotransferase